MQIAVCCSPAILHMPAQQPTQGSNVRDFDGWVRDTAQGGGTGFAVPLLLLLLLLLLRHCAVLMCEGLDHPDAVPTDRWAAAQQLHKATEHALMLEAAKPKGWLPEHLYEQQ